MNTLYIIDLIGTCVFAISGSQTATDKKMDVFGISAVGFITAVGGGTVRDVLIGSTPVGWMKDLNYLLVIVLGIIIAIIFRQTVSKLRKTLFLFDTIGISVFTILGVEKTLELGLNPIISVMMGMVSAVFGGVTRDIICNEIPLIFRKEIYAITCILGGALYVFFYDLIKEKDLLIAATIIVIIVTRSLSVKYNWKLPAKS